MTEENKYFVDNIDITDLIAGAGAGNRQDFKNFPNGWSANKNVAKCFDFGYKYNGTDIGPYYRGYEIIVTGSGDIDLTTTTNRKFKHMSALVYGGGGGGGGGGGLGWNGSNRNGAGPGNPGGYGGYAWSRGDEINSYNQISYGIGIGGNGGARGNDSNTPNGRKRGGQNGYTGGPGNDSYVNLPSSSDSSTVAYANGGGGGSGGNGGRNNTDQFSGTPGNNSSSQGGVGSDVTGNNANVYDHNNYGGNGGANQTAGNSGGNGKGWVWLLYQK